MSCPNDPYRGARADLPCQCDECRTVRLLCASFNFEPEPKDGGDLVVCPECKEASPIRGWRESSVYCDVCGDHPALVCPECEEYIDSVWTTFKVKH